MAIRSQYKQVVELCFRNFYLHRMTQGLEQNRNGIRMTDKQYNIVTVLGSQKAYKGINIALLELHVELRESLRFNAKTLCQRFCGFDRTLKVAGEYRFDTGIF